MRVRRFELRLLAGTLTVAWAVAAALVLFGYRPGGPADLLVGLAAVPAVAVAAMALTWPPVARGDRAFASMFWLGVGATLVLVPSILALVDQLTGGGPQTLLPSVEAAYPWLLAMTGTALFAGLGIARRVLGESSLRRPRLALGSAIGGGLLLVAAVPFATAAIANDRAVRDQPAARSPYGPTDPGLELPTCDGPLAAGTTARVRVALESKVDQRAAGWAEVDGVRDGSDVRWTAFVASGVDLGPHGLVRRGDEGWVLEPGQDWIIADAASLDPGLLDLQVVATALTAGNRVAAEDRGTGLIEGAPARRCRIAIDGPTFRAAFPQISWLIDPAAVERWRGEVEYWVFADGQLGRLDGHLNGEGAAMVPTGVLGTIQVTLDATHRGGPVSIPRPI